MDSIFKLTNKIFIIFANVKSYFTLTYSGWMNPYEEVQINIQTLIATAAAGGS
jgi:hypothetical protein